MKNPIRRLLENQKLRRQLHETITEADTVAGKTFDIVLLVMILISVLIVMLESMPGFGTRANNTFVILEWVFTIFFTIEYILRIYSSLQPRKYIFSFFGIVDLLAIIPTYLSIFIVGSSSLMVIRAIRLLRVFRIMKLVTFTRQGRLILYSLQNSLPKILVFLMFILILVSVFGSMMYLIEGGSNDNFDSIPRSIYWAIVTLTTVGYGDITPSTSLGQFLAGFIMLLGYAVIAVPTGIISADVLRRASRFESTNTTTCRYCGDADHADSAEFCKSCGHQLHE